MPNERMILKAVPVPEGNRNIQVGLHFTASWARLLSGLLFPQPEKAGWEVGWASASKPDGAELERGWVCCSLTVRSPGSDAPLQSGTNPEWGWGMVRIAPAKLTPYLGGPSQAAWTDLFPFTYASLHLCFCPFVTQEEATCLL